jgi:hypothetical protein
MEKKYAGSLHERLDLRGFENGTYFISVASGSGTKTKKLTINH